MMSETAVTKLFETAYNRALCFRKYQEKDRLMPKGRYSLPACLKHVLDDFIEQIQTDKCMYQVGGKQFSFEKVENGISTLEFPLGQRGTFCGN